MREDLLHARTGNLVVVQMPKQAQGGPSFDRRCSPLSHTARSGLVIECG